MMYPNAKLTDAIRLLHINLADEGIKTEDVDLTSPERLLDPFVHPV